MVKLLSDNTMVHFYLCVDFFLLMRYHYTNEKKEFILQTQNAKLRRF